MAVLLPPKGKPDEEEACLPDLSPRSKGGDSFFFFFFCFFSQLGLIKFVTIVALFMAGAVLGLSFSTAFTRYHPSQIDVFIPTILTTSNCGGNRRGDHYHYHHHHHPSQSLRGFIHPSKLIHGMTDEELFWRASMVPRKVQYPYRRVPKVAFLFLTRGPLPLAPLWERFFRGHDEYFSVYVHPAPDYNPLNVSQSSPFYGRQIPSEDAEWGSITLVDAAKRLLANALLDFSNERFVLLSETCIPVHNFPTVYKYLVDSEQSYVEMYDEDSGAGRGRYSWHMAPDILLSHWRKGSEWFEMDRDLATTMVSDSKYHDIFRRYCRPSCFPDEHYIPTFINMFNGSLNSNRTLTWVDWSRGGVHPATYGSEDITTDFISSIRNNGTKCKYNKKPTSTCHLFARKFAPSALEPLLKIASDVMKY